jgi:hydrogenase maturation protein HypF
LSSPSPQLLATGGELKNTFCFVRDRYAFLSHHIGDMENYETYQSFQDGISRYEALFHIKPEAIAYDLHPNYLATRYAIERAEREGMPSYGIQHHHAHIVSCMAEHLLPADQPVIGISFDGTGYGDDGAIWGGEFLLADYRGYERICHLKYIPLPGGDVSIHKPARIALAYLWSSQLEWEPELHPVSALCAEELSILKSQLRLRLNTHLKYGTFF